MGGALGADPFTRDPYLSRVFCGDQPRSFNAVRVRQPGHVAQGPHCQGHAPAGRGARGPHVSGRYELLEAGVMDTAGGPIATTRLRHSLRPPARGPTASCLRGMFPRGPGTKKKILAASSGNTGCSLALVGTLMGYEVRAVGTAQRHGCRRLGSVCQCRRSHDL